MWVEGVYYEGKDDPKREISQNIRRLAKKNLEDINKSIIFAATILLFNI